MKKTYMIIRVFLLVLACGTLHAQEQNISGSVKDAAGSPLPGSSIAIKGTTKGTIADAMGKFTIQAPAGSTLRVSAIGYLAQDVKADNGAIDITLAEDVNALEEVVVSGLATSVKRSNLANAVTTISARELVGTTSPVTTDGALQGKLAGANIQSNGSMPGGGFNVQFRGVSTLGASASQPLFIVD